MMNTFLWRRFRRQKQGILDIQLELNDSTKINIEMQMEQKAHWKTRTVFYLAKMFTADLRRGEAYKKAKNALQLRFWILIWTNVHNITMSTRCAISLETSIWIY